jgi:hypothetical protein
MLEWLFGGSAEEIPDWYRREQQMHMAQARPAQSFRTQADWATYEFMLIAKARKLVGDVDPAFNMTPIIELVREADRLGFDVVSR